MIVRHNLSHQVSKSRAFYRPRLRGDERASREIGGHPSRRVVWAIAVLCVAAGCSSGSSASSSSIGTSIAPSTSSSVSSLAPSVTTTTVPTTTTTSTTIDPSTQADEQVRAAYQLASDTYSACLVAMPHCDTATLAVARAGALLDRNIARIDDWQSKGYTIRNRDKFRSVVEQVTIAPDAKSATLISCIADGSSLVLPGAGPGGADVIIDDAFTSGRDRWDFVLDPDGVWRAHDGGAAGPTESTDICPAS